MSGLSRAVTWTQRVGYSYPPRYFPAAVKDRFRGLSPLEVEHCVAVYEDAHGDWMRRVEMPPGLREEHGSRERV